MEYSALKKRVASCGGLRLSAHGSMRDQIVDMVVAAWPKDCPGEMLADVLHARVSQVVKRGKSRAYGLFLSRLMVKPIARFCAEWYLEKQAHRLLMEGWCAKKAKDI
jgi:hypothetical protein